MPTLTAKYKLEDIDLSLYPSSITLTHGKDKSGFREWWEWKQKDKAIVIQRLGGKTESWLIFFQLGDIFRTLELPLTDEDKAKRIVARTFGTYDLDEAIKALAELGIIAKTEGS